MMINNSNSDYISAAMIDPRLNELYIEAALKVGLAPQFALLGETSEENDYSDNVESEIEGDTDK